MFNRVFKYRQQLREFNAKFRNPLTTNLIKLIEYYEIRKQSISDLTINNQGLVWNGMERKFRNGLWKMPEWNGMEDFKNGMEDNLPYFHTNFILDFVHCIYRKIHIDVG